MYSLVTNRDNISIHNHRDYISNIYINYYAYANGTKAQLDYYYIYIIVKFLYRINFSVVKYKNMYTVFQKAL